MAVLKDLIVHGRSRFVNGIDADKIEANAIKADSGIFNQLIATTLEAKNASIDELTAQNATVFGIMDVKGKLQTNQWEAASIANIGGNFYISPTGKSSSGTVTITRTSAASGSVAAKYSVTMSGTFGVGTTSGTIWASGAYGMATGNVSVGTKKYPLGTCDGPLSNISTGTNTITGFTISNVESAALDIIFDENASLISSNAISSKPGTDLQVSVYLGKSESNYMPVGILLTSYGKDNKQYIDIYDGGHSAGTSITGFADPVVRIGDLSGLNSYTPTGQSYTINPEGWGIYTSNGYFKGAVYADLGYIGGWTIETDKLYSGAHNTYNSEQNGIYLGTSTETDTPYYIAGGPNAQWWLKSDGTAKIGDLLLQYNENEEFTLSVPMANITGTLKANLVDADTLEAITGNMGTLNAGRIQGGTSGTEGFMFISPENYGESLIVANSSSKTDWKLILGTNFGIDSAGKLYGTNVNLQGVINASEFSVVENGNTYMSANAQGINIGMTSGFHLQATNEKLSFYANQNSELAYLSGSHLYIKQVVVLDQMDVGFPFDKTTPSNNEVGKGQWSWKVHLNGENPPKNNLYLKWIG